MTNVDCRGTLLRDCAAALADAGLTLCVLHGYQRYPHRVESDLDCICSEPLRIPHVLSDRGVATVVQAIEMGPDAYYYVIHRACDAGHALVAVDVAVDYRRDGMRLLTRHELARSCRSMGEINVPDPAIEFVAYLVKRVLKGLVDPDQARRLSRLYQIDPAGCAAMLRRFFPAGQARRLGEAASTGEWEPIRRQLAALKRALRRRHRRAILPALRDGAIELGRRLRRFLHPTGLWVAVVGPNGSGKSSLIARIETDLAPMFWQVDHVSGDTANRKSPDRDREQPSAAVAPHPSLKTSWNDAVRAHARVLRSTLVLDETSRPIAPRRFGPRPDLVLMLDAPLESLHSRRPDVPLNELKRQQAAWLKAATGAQSTHVIDSARPIDVVSRDVEDLIIGHMAARTARRLRVGRRPWESGG